MTEKQLASGLPYFHQPQGLWVLVQELRTRGCPHILVYSGYTYERLRRMAERELAVSSVLDNVDILIDGPFVARLTDSGGPWTGSGNQRAIDLLATREAGRVVACAQPRGFGREAMRGRTLSRQS